ncbi:MAG: hypothetical protein JW749_09740 [Sedimentisphaerales bacterium]|nr:hypothetical protein [Sedimentisphaerales bacterium]
MPNSRGSDNIWPDWLCAIIGLCSGLLLAIPAIYSAFVPLQIIALIPVFYLGASKRAGSLGLIAAGLFMSIAYILPQLFVLRLPVLFVAPLAGFGAILMIVEVWAFGKLLAGPGISGAIAAGALLVVIDWVLFTALPGFGTGPSLVRPWSRYPALIQFVSITGLTGVNFVLGSLQALVVKLIVSPQSWRKALICITAIVAVISTTDIVIKYRQPVGRLKVAAVGWTNADVERHGRIKSKRGFKTLLSEPIINAAENGARLIVCPETVLWLPAASQKGQLEHLAQIARSHSIYLAIGYGDKKTNENRMMFIDPCGQVIGEYTKTYLAYFEHFKKGDGRLTQVNIDGFAVGAMICADDGYTRLSREYGRKGVPLVAVLNNDWLQIKDFHLQNSIHRAIESRYAVVRATSNGISAIVSPDGRVLARKDHFTEGPGFIMAEVPLYSCRTMFSILGHWPAAISVIFLAIYLFFKFKTACVKI